MSESLPPARRDDDDLEEPGRTRITEQGIREVGFDDPELRPLPPDKLHYHVPHSDAHPEQHEHSDVPIRPLAIALIGLAAMCVVTILLCYFVFWGYKSQQEARDVPRTMVPMPRPDVPEPRLQGVPGYSDNHPSQDQVQMKEHFDAELTTYGRSADGAKARVPIGRAMDLALERKIFPVRGQGAQQPAPKGGAK